MIANLQSGTLVLAIGGAAGYGRPAATLVFPTARDIGRARNARCTAGAWVPGPR
ncbi:hypothetical protein [Streptomyces sp. PH10-H1]|uniref:hypothetical protein n=1 Tax=Streptomyces sp. PH10-H1 TaxID=3046212 RepID=UPI0024BAF45E|nr:hypothetical protein [Streptomyces sp. PH10-H1]